jgi:hypothetical protein
MVLANAPHTSISSSKERHASSPVSGDNIAVLRRVHTADRKQRDVASRKVRTGNIDSMFISGEAFFRAVLHAPALAPALASFRLFVVGPTV